MSTNRSASHGIVTTRAAPNRNDSHSAASERERPDSQTTHGHQNADGATAKSKRTEGATTERKYASGEPAHGQPTGGYIADGNNPPGVTAEFALRQVGSQSDCPQRQPKYLAFGLAADAARHPQATPREQQSLRFLEFTRRQSALLVKVCQALKFFSQVHNLGFL